MAMNTEVLSIILQILKLNAGQNLKKENANDLVTKLSRDFFK